MMTNIIFQEKSVNSSRFDPKSSLYFSTTKAGQGKG